MRQTHLHLLLVPSTPTHTHPRARCLTSLCLNFLTYKVVVVDSPHKVARTVCEGKCSINGSYAALEGRCYYYLFYNLKILNALF